MQRNHFTPDQGVYLLSHSVGRPLISCAGYLEDHFIEHWQSGSEVVWQHWLDEISQFQAALASLFNAHADHFCPQVNLSSALSKLLASLSFADTKKTFLLSEEDFPSIGFVMKMAERYGYRLSFIPASADLCDLNVWQHHLTDDVALVLVSHVYSNTGVQSNVAEISALCRQKNIVSIIDVAQSAGVLPIDLQQWDVDFIVGSCVKWLCGGPGAGFLYVRPDIAGQCKPVDVGWFSHQNPFAMEIHDFHYAEGARRFWGGTPSVIPYVVATNSINTINEIGVPAIRAHNVKLSQTVIDSLPEHYIYSPFAENDRSGTLVLNFSDEQPNIESKLKEASIKFDVRKHGIRVSPHIYNTSEEIEYLLRCITR